MQNKEVGISALVPIIKEAIQNNSTINLTPKGLSMLPFLSEREVVTLSKPKFPLKKYDIIFYYRERTGAYVMHRVVGIGDNDYICCGDNQFMLERVSKDNVIAQVTDIKRDKKFVCEWLYCRTLFARRFFKHIKCKFLK